MYHAYDTAVQLTQHSLSSISTAMIKPLPGDGYKARDIFITVYVVSKKYTNVMCYVNEIPSIG